MRWFIKLISYAVVFSGLVASTARADNPELRRQLTAIDIQRDGLNTPSDRLEREGLALLQRFNTPEEKGLIYAQIALVYAQNGLTNSEKTIEYCRKALDHPLETITSCRMYVHWADGLQAKHRADQGEVLAASRHEIATVCLRGLKLILDQNPPPAAQDLPVVHKFDCPAIPDDPTCQELLNKNREEMAARQRVLFQNELVLYRDILIDKCASVLSGAGQQAENDFKEIAKEVLRDDRQIQEALRRINDRRNPSQ